MVPIKVLVVDDSIFMRKLISRLVDADPSVQVIGTAKNGLEAVQLTKELGPQVITMDIEMPQMNGLDALTQIMQERPTPVVMLSSLTQEGAEATIAALNRGAVDFVPKPSGSISADLYKVQEELVDKIKIASKASPRASASPHKPGGKSRQPVTRNQEAKPLTQIVAIGTSTGGPRALETVICSLPDSFHHPILVVQHMPPNFTRSLAQRLDAASALRVVEAEDKQLIQGGTVYIAPGGWHMTAVETGGELRIRLSQDKVRNGHRPSVDILFESVSRLTKFKRHLVIMTGMGNDGARGMLLAKESGASSTIAEAKETCVVYGMPKSAVELDCVDHVVSLERIAGKIMDVTNT